MRPRASSFRASWFFAWSFAVGWVCLGCAARLPAEPPAFAALMRDPHQVVSRIAWLRQLPERRRTRLEFHHASEFRDIVRNQVESHRIASTPADHPAFQQVFGLAGTGGSTATSLSNVQREEVVAFFDERTFTVHVRIAEDEPGHTELKPAWVVAHEIGHSLQHQHFPIPDVQRMPDEDQRLAALAMLEGDAMLVMLAYASDEQHAPLSRVIVRVQRALTQETTDPSLRVAHVSAALQQAPRSVRERLVFPYLAGVAFMGALYRTGGYPLVNHVYQTPPVSTEQILHPEKYLAGEAPVRIQSPRLPHGFEPVTAGRMGELQTKTMLQGCHDPQTAARAAAGWGGDAFVVGRRGGDVLLLWATSWDSETDAEEFETAVLQTASCWQRELGAVSGAAAALRIGPRVAVTRGLAPEHAAPVLRALLELPEVRSTSVPPTRALQLRPVPAEPVKAPSRLLGQTVYAPYLGLMIPVPSGFQVQLTGDIRLQAQDNTGSTLILVSNWLVTPATNERLFANFLHSFARANNIDQARLELVDQGTLATPLGPAFQRTWRASRTHLFARAVVVPACQATGALLLAQSWSKAKTVTQMDGMLAGIRQFGAKLPPICSDLNP